LEPVFGRFRVASSRIALVLVVAILLSVLLDVLLSILGQGGGKAFWVVLIPFAVFGAVVARRQPGNPIATVLLLVMLTVVASSDAAHYAVLRYRDGDHGLPLGRVAAFLAPGAWMWLVVFLPLPLALFPDGRLSRGWRRAFWAYLVLAAAFVAVNVWQNASAILGTPASNTAYKVVILLYLGVGGLAWSSRLLLNYRRASGDYCQQ
jgi:hypothetical protein